MAASSLLSPSTQNFLTEDPEPEYVVAIIDDQRMRVRADRRPSLYTADYGDCLDHSAINVTRFDAAYYKDNMTILFHLAGETALKNESIMMHIGVYAYGQSRFGLTFNPCDANMWSACPVLAGKSIEAQGIIPVNEADVAGIPDIALSIPDFEGEAILRLFSNSTQAEIGCFAAKITNGNTFQQQAIVGTILGVFTLVATISSFTTAIYGDDVTDIRKHYAHSQSVLVIFAIWQHIFYSGALSMNWPSVLVAFWSNYAWAGGMMYSEHMQNTINKFIGYNQANLSHVGDAVDGVDFQAEGEYDIRQIYGRGLLSTSSEIQEGLHRRELIDGSSGFTYYGKPVKPGLPLPGNFSGFAGTLAQSQVPASNAFMTGLLWFLMAIGCVVMSVIALKVILEGLVLLRLMRPSRLAFFRARYLGYTAAAFLRTLFVGFFMMCFLSMVQFSYLGSPAPLAIACLVLAGMVFSVGTVSGVAVYTRIVLGEYGFQSDRLKMSNNKTRQGVPEYTILESKSPLTQVEAHAWPLSWWKVKSSTGAGSIHQDRTFTKRFGWLVSRYRATRWWFFGVWTLYELARACFLAGFSSRPTLQVLSFFVLEIVAQRLNVLLVYLLGISKFELPRITATVVGIAIIVIQGLLTVAAMVCIIMGAVSSYLSAMRNRQEIRPRPWNAMRGRYFEDMEHKAQGIRRPRPQAKPVQPSFDLPRTPYFSVNHVKRMAKVEDEDDDFMKEIMNTSSTCRVPLFTQSLGDLEELPSQRSRATSLQSQCSQSSLPRAARLHRSVWSSQDSGRIQREGGIDASKEHNSNLSIS
ncbi:TRP-domain-containing protein [Pyrenochaeta sp. DS3sAY3a]|nr:TRP-domain-containing protein [Pyrenochaeta sp. DS3sAY3a]